MEAPDGYCASNGQCSPGKENSRMLADVSTSNGQTVPQGPNSPDELTIKQEEDTVEETDNRSPALEETAHTEEEGVALEESMTGSPSIIQDGFSGPAATPESGSRQPNGDRPFQCSQCGVSFTQKGNLLRHIKLHTGEKPFKCPFCSYACRRRDALTGHLRTHAVGKPHKCNYCGRSYKQRTSLEEHKERCHSYLQGTGLDPAANTGPYTGDIPKELRPMADANVMATFDRPPVIEKLHNNVGKRKSTTPQKFVGEKMARYPEVNYDIGLKYEKPAEMMPAHMMDQAISNAITYLGSESLRPMLHHPGPPLSMAEVVPIVNPLFHHVLQLGQRTERPGNCDTLPLHPPQPHDFPNHPTLNGATAITRQGKPPQSGHEESPNNSGVDSADSALSSPHERSGFHGSNATSGLRSQGSPAVVYSGERVTEASPKSMSGIGTGLMRVATERPVSQDGVRVFGREGQELRAFQCEHCRVLFLDHVMYTIHMGCHGYRDPLECNICGHRSKDRYEFSSHIVRGEHTFQ
ncbi:zinc finger protein Helios [Echeneis naucrates]|uniref:C2H2-type domain-containing protein n=1 Tax=Echeneis naucrates TaxID=173247 RepID=A0A665XCP7_ECHNA|nr:zinc finger protein Helios [Echeneis naucrates]XP_029386044.1 zinc finger protein Helios [Echeneis naucrates]XP_029386045.1 zinc finger protein Helios [Echeneis naucrates]